MKELLQLYREASGQKVNLSKSSLVFSANTREESKQDLCEVLGTDGSIRLGKYLGLRTEWSTLKVQALDFVEERIKRKVQGWKASTMLQAGREVMIKAVSMAIPGCPKTRFRFPKKWC